MRHIRYYNIHDILKIRIVELEKLLNSNSLYPFSFFEVQEEFEEPEITLNIGRFTPSRNLKDCYFLLRKYYIDKDYLYSEDSLGAIKWRFEIVGVEDKETIINFDVCHNPISLFFGTLLSQNLLLRHMIGLKLCRKGYFLVHAAGLSGTNTACLLIGAAGSNKTELTIYFIRHADFKFLGDDGVIIGNQKKAFGFPINSELFYYRLKYNKTRNINLLDKLRVFIINMSVGETNARARALRQYVTLSSTLSSLIFLVKTNSKKICFNEISISEAVKRIIEITKLEMCLSPIPMIFPGDSGRFLECMLAYSYIFPNSKVAKYWSESETQVRRLLEGLSVYQLEIPDILTPRALRYVHKLIEGQVSQ